MRIGKIGQSIEMMGRHIATLEHLQQLEINPCACRCLNG